MTGAQALVYSRSRHGSNDFDRAARQQRVILSLRQQADFATLARPDVLSALVQATKGAVKTDFPIDRLPQLIALAQRIDIGNVRSFVFSPPYFGTEGYVNGLYVLQANVSRIRRAAANAFDFSPREQAQRQEIAEEGAIVLGRHRHRARRPERRRWRSTSTTRGSPRRPRAGRPRTRSPRRRS